MKITFQGNQLVIEDDDLVPRLDQIHQVWPDLLDEYLNMIIRNRERRLERIEVTRELIARKQIRLEESQNSESKNKEVN